MRARDLQLIGMLMLVGCTGGQGDGTATMEAADVELAALDLPSVDIVVTMLPARDATSGQIVFLRTSQEPGRYVEGSAAFAAIVQNLNEDVGLFHFLAEPPVGAGVDELMSCIAVIPLDAMPQHPSWVGLAEEVEPREIAGYEFNEGVGPQEILVRHSPGAIAVLVETADGITILIRPISDLAYAAWTGDRPVSFTVFWPDGASAEWADR